MQYYIELAGGQPTFHRNVFVPYSPEKIKSFVEKEDNTDVFMSVCLYDDLNVATAKCVAPLVFDIDCEETPHYAHGDAVWLVYELMKEGFAQEDIFIYFSGNKGFHIVVPGQVIGLEPMRDVMKLYKKVGENYSKKSPHKTIDLVIYEKRRLFRIPFSKHSKTGLYKNLITLEQLNSLPLEEIKKLCEEKGESTQKHSGQINKKFQKYVNSLRLLFDESATREYEAVEQIPDDQEIAIPPCVLKILKTPPPQGERNSATYNLALFFKVNGYSPQRTVDTLLEWSGLDRGEVETTVHSAYESQFEWGCGSSNQFIPEEFQGQCCQAKAQRISDDTFIPFQDAVKSTEKFLLEERKNTRLTTGYTSIDTLLSGVLDNDFIVIAAGVGFGKSLFAANMALTNARAGNKVAFMSLEMINEQVVTRFIQSETGLDNTTIASQSYTPQQKKQIKEAVQKLDKDIPLFFFNRDNIYTVENIEKAIKKAIELHGLDMLIIDHLRYIGRDGSSKEHEEIDKICTALQKLSQRYNICVVLLAHYNKGDETRPREMTELLGSNAVYREATKILQIWRRIPRDDVEEAQMTYKDKLVRFICQKNRFGTTGVKLMGFDIKRQTFEEVDPGVLVSQESQKNEKERMLDRILSQNHE